MTNPNVRPDLEALKVLLSKATPGPWAVCGMRGKAHNIGKNAVFHDVGPDGTSVAAVWFQESDGLGFMDAKLIAAAVSQLPDLIAHIERLQSDLRAIDRIVEDNITETDGPHRARWKGEWIEGPAAEMIHSLLRGMQKIARATLSQGKTHE